MAYVAALHALIASNSRTLMRMRNVSTCRAGTNARRCTKALRNSKYVLMYYDLRKRYVQNSRMVPKQLATSLFVEISQYLQYNNSRRHFSQHSNIFDHG
jgi:hypothetical protein